jgi:hypothetical protein
VYGNENFNIKNNNYLINIESLTSPSSQPSSQPSRQPTYEPSSQPSSVPTDSPVSSKPTNEGDTNYPTSIPTPVPTFNLINYDDSPVYERYLETIAEYQSNPDSTFTFGSFFYKGIRVNGGQCEDWQRFLSTELDYDDVQYNSMKVNFENYDYENFGTNDYTSLCNDTSTINRLITNLKRGNSYYEECWDGKKYNVWKTFSCGWDKILCLNCDGTCSTKTSCPGTASIFNPCSKCGIQTAASAIMDIGYTDLILYPIIDCKINVVRYRTSLTVNANIIGRGNIYCGAFTNDEYKLVETISSIRNMGNLVMLTDANTTATVDILNLNPDTAYNVACYTEDFVGHLMPIELVLGENGTISNQTSITSTLCCKGIYYSKFYDNIYEYVPGSGRVENIFQFTLDTKPQGNVTIHISGLAVDCTTHIQKSPTTYAIIYPPSFHFDQSSTYLSGNFNIRTSSSGSCLQLLSYTKESDGNGNYGNYSSAVEYTTVNKLRIPPHPPKFESVSFSRNGMEMVIDFNVETDYAASTITDYATSFFCFHLLFFYGFENAMCRWQNNKQLIATFPVPLLKPLNVGDNVKLFKDKLRAACVSNQDCTGYKYTDDVYFNITATLNPIVPIVVITAPSVVASCDQLDLDARASGGNAGRDWLQILWTAKSPTETLAFNSSYLTSYVNIGGRSTSKPVYLPSKKLTPGTYLFTLQLTNFLYQTSIAAVSVIVTNVIAVPRVTILGQRNRFISPHNEINLYVNSSVNSCAKVGDIKSLRYVWQVYSNKILLPEIKSISKDNRFFKLSSYTLLPNVNYIVKVIAFMETEKDKTTTALSGSSSININVGTSSLFASINDGDYETYCLLSGENLKLDASSSYDQNVDPNIPVSENSNGFLTYKWDCIEISPTYGIECVNLNLNSKEYKKDKISIDPLLIHSGKRYSFKVIVTNQDGLFSEANKTIITTNDRIPSISFSQIQSKYNPSERIVLTSIINAPETNATVTWSTTALGFTLEDDGISVLSPVTRAPKGVSTFQLAINPHVLISGLQYTFVIEAIYFHLGVDVKLVPSFKEITINTNSPPIGGEFSVTPATNGLALKTKFLFHTQEWQDDSSDYPLLYVFLYYIQNPETSSNILKAKSEVVSEYYYLGVGLKSLYYQVTCVVYVTDIYGGIANLTKKVEVKQDHQTTIESVRTTATELISIANATNNPALYPQVMSIVTNYLNILDCLIVGKTCASKFRENCQTTTRTCGPCLPGYFGVPGDSNLQCSLKGALSIAGRVCGSNTGCLSSLCLNGICTEPLKTCRNDCNGRGECVFIDDNGQTVDECHQKNIFCKAICICQRGRYGNDCHIDRLADYEENLEFREELCIIAYNTMQIEDFSYYNIVNRILTLSNILIDSDLVTDNALSVCTNVLVTTVNDNMDLIASDKYLTNLIMSLISKTVDRGVDVPVNILDTSKSLLTDLADNVLIHAVLGEPIVLVTENIRLSMTVSDMSSLDFSSTKYYAPQTDFEKFSDIAQAALSYKATPSGTGIIGVTISQFNSNPEGGVSNSTKVNLQTKQYASSFGTSNSRRLVTTSTLPSNSPFKSTTESRSLSSSSLSVTIQLPNVKWVNYTRLYPSNEIIYCYFSPEVYTENGTCPSGLNYFVNCPGNVGKWNISCPGHHEIPICVMRDENGLSENPYCDVVDFDSESTTCNCDDPRINNEADINQFSSVLKVISTSYSAEYIEAEKIIVSIHNSNVIACLVVIVLMLIAGLLGFLFWDHKDINNKNSIKPIVKNLNKRSVESFFSEIIPDDFESNYWHHQLWNTLSREHSWICLFIPPVPGQKDRVFRSALWIYCIYKFFTFVLLNTMFASFLYSDDGSCELIRSENQCLTATSYLEFRTICKWREDINYCMYEELPTTYYNVVLLSFIISIIAIPVNNFVKYICHNAGNVEIFNLFTPKISDFDDDEEEDNNVYSDDDSDDESKKEVRISRKERGLLDIFTTIQTSRGKILRGARITNQQENIDFKSPPEESSYLLEHHVNNNKKNKSLMLTILHDLGIYIPLDKKKREPAIKKKVLKLIRSSRKTSKKIVTEMNSMELDLDREIFLMRHFLLDRFRGVRRKYANFFIFPIPPPSLAFKVMRLVKCLICFGFVFILFIMYVALIASFNSSIGTRAMNLWIAVCNLTILMDMFVIEPLYLWIKAAIIDYIFGYEFNAICHRIRKYSKILLMRSSGVIRDSNNFFHHFNPACRAARMFPYLPVSRMLISLSDVDVPQPFQSKNLLDHFLWFIFNWSYFTIAYFPFWIQNILLALFSVILFYTTLIILGSVGNLSTGLAIFLGISIIIGWSVKELQIYMNYQRTLNPPKLSEDDFNDDVEKIAIKDRKDNALNVKKGVKNVLEEEAEVELTPRNKESNLTFSTPVDNKIIVDTSKTPLTHEVEEFDLENEEKEKITVKASSDVINNDPIINEDNTNTNISSNEINNELPSTNETEPVVKAKAKKNGKNEPEPVKVINGAPIFSSKKDRINTDDKNTGNNGTQPIMKALSTEEAKKLEIVTYDYLNDPFSSINQFEKNFEEEKNGVDNQIIKEEFNMAYYDNELPNAQKRIFQHKPKVVNATKREERKKRRDLEYNGKKQHGHSRKSHRKREKKSARDKTDYGRYYEDNENDEIGIVRLGVEDEDAEEAKIDIAALDEYGAMKRRFRSTRDSKKSKTLDNGEIEFNDVYTAGPGHISTSAYYEAEYGQAHVDMSRYLLLEHDCLLPEVDFIGFEHEGGVVDDVVNLGLKVGPGAPKPKVPLKKKSNKASRPEPPTPPVPAPVHYSLLKKPKEIKPKIAILDGTVACEVGDVDDVEEEKAQIMISHLVKFPMYQPGYTPRPEEEEEEEEKEEEKEGDENVIIEGSDIVKTSAILADNEKNQSNNSIIDSSISEKKSINNSDIKESNSKVE